MPDELKPYFCKDVLAHELTAELNAFIEQGYDVVNVFPLGEYNGNFNFQIIAKLRPHQTVAGDIEHDLSVHGVHITQGGERVDPKDFYKSGDEVEELGNALIKTGRYGVEARVIAVDVIELLGYRQQGKLSDLVPLKEEILHEIWFIGNDRMPPRVANFIKSVCSQCTQPSVPSVTIEDIQVLIWKHLLWSRGRVEQKHKDESWIAAEAIHRLIGGKG